MTYAFTEKLFLTVKLPLFGQSLIYSLKAFCAKKDKCAEQLFDKCVSPVNIKLSH